MSSHKERFADKMEFPPATVQPNVYPLSWNNKTKKLQEVWEAALRENWDPEKLPWDTLDVDSYSWEERESIAYWWSLLSVFDASAPPVFAEALIKTYEVHEEDPVRKCFFSVTRDEQNHEIMCGLAITKMLGHPDPLTYQPKTELGKRLQKNVQWLYFNGGRYWTGIQPQAVIGELAAQLARAVRTLDVHGQISLALREVDEARHDQQLHLYARMALAEMAQLRRQEEAAETLGRTQAHMAGEHVAVAAYVLAHQHHGAFHALHMLQQALAHGREQVTGRRALEQPCAQLLLQPVQAARDGGMVQLQAPGSLLRRLGTHHGEEQAQVVPVDAIHGHACGNCSGANLH